MKYSKMKETIKELFLKISNKISYDKRVDRMDLPEVSALEEVISQEKQGILSHTKEKLLAHIEQSLIDGFTVETQEDYEVLKKFETGMCLRRLHF